MTFVIVRGTISKCKTNVDRIIASNTSVVGLFVRVFVCTCVRVVRVQVFCVKCFIGKMIVFGI